MRHLYFRFILGIVWFAAAIFSFLSANVFFAALYVLLGIVFLRSAFSLQKKEKSKSEAAK